MAGVVEGLISDLVAKGVERIASRKKLTSQDLTVLLLHQQSESVARMEKGVDEVANELREMRREVVPLLNQAKDIADIKSRMERIEAKVT
jgi:archaellum component FlaC|nr:hypothetical protein [Ferrimicrobium acidiphilum]